MMRWMLVLGLVACGGGGEEDTEAVTQESLLQSCVDLCALSAQGDGCDEAAQPDCELADRYELHQAWIDCELEQEQTCENGAVVYHEACDDAYQAYASCG